MPELTEPWGKPDDEREVLVQLVVPSAQAQYDQALHRWTSLDAKAFGLLGLVAAVIAGLATFRDEVQHLWWAPAVGFAVAGVFFIRTIWQRPLIFGPDLIDFHDEMRSNDVLVAARAMVESLTDATDSVEEGYREKGRNFEVGLAILVVSVVGSLPVLLFRN
jgi:hypothetical protein